MKIAAFLTALLVAGFATSLALAKSPNSDGKDEGTSTSATTSTTQKPSCHQVELKGDAASGSVTFKVTKANKQTGSLVGSSLTLTIPSGASVKAKACTSASGPPTLTLLHVRIARDKKQGDEHDDD
jgi:uncharacterized protein (UPF0333 family)